VGEFARVWANFIPPAEQFGRALETTDLLTSGRSAYLTAFQPNRANRKHGGGWEYANNGHSANRDQTEKNTGYEKRRSWDAGNIAENTVNKGSGNLGAGILPKSPTNFPDEAFI